MSQVKRILITEGFCFMIVPYILQNKARGQEEDLAPSPSDTSYEDKTTYKLKTWHSFMECTSHMEIWGSCG